MAQYLYDEDEDEHDYNDDKPYKTVAEKSISMVHFLGKTYDPLEQFEIRRKEERSLFWFTYRCDFPTIVPYGITTDAGWGCMLRSAQMMLAQTLRLHFKGPNWKPPKAIAYRKDDSFIRNILTWFADSPSQDECRYSLHNMVATGLSRYETLPGEWYGPGTVCYVMRDLCRLHEQQVATTERKGINGDMTRPMFRVYLAAQGSVYRDAVEDLMTRDGRRHIEKPKPRLSHPLDLGGEPDETTAVAWDTSLLVLIPLRLGLKSFNESYAASLAYVFSLRQSVGVLGGRPRGARWFCGATSDGTKLYGLDPHTVQNAPQLRKMRNGNTMVSLTDDYVRSVHCGGAEVIPLHRIDPSLSLGFYCRDRSDFDQLCNSILRWREASASGMSTPELFTIADVSPDYSTSDNMMFPGGPTHGINDSFADGEEADLSEEDEYIVL